MKTVGGIQERSDGLPSSLPREQHKSCTAMLRNRLYPPAEMAKALYLPTFPALIPVIWRG